jgi:hypothetical protein
MLGAGPHEEELHVGVLSRFNDVIGGADKVIDAIGIAHDADVADEVFFPTRSDSSGSAVVFMRFGAVRTTKARSSRSLPRSFTARSTL